MIQAGGTKGKCHARISLQCSISACVTARSSAASPPIYAGMMMSAAFAAQLLREAIDQAEDACRQDQDEIEKGDRRRPGAPEAGPAQL